MPTYDYQCGACSHEMEVSQKISDEPLTVCPKCGESALNRGVGGGCATFRFVGSGFYINDYKKDCGCKEECSNLKQE